MNPNSARPAPEYEAHAMRLTTISAGGPCTGDKMRPWPPSPRSGGRHAHCVGPHRLSDVLDALAATRAVFEVELVPDLIVDGLRNAHCAGFGQRFEPGGDVDAVSEDIVAVDDHVAKIDADPQFETPFRRKRIVERARGLLHLDSAAERVDDAGKIRQQAVARRADDTPAMCGDQRIDGVSQFAECPVRASLVHAHQPAEADDIRV